MRCSRGCLYSSMRILNLIINLCGILMIIYSLWLLKKWDEGVTQLPFSASIPRPWFISTCLVVGIVVCLSTLSGHMVANCISNYTLAIYIISIFSLLLIQAGVIVTIFFRMDWESEIIKYIDENHESFKSFILFHLVMCRLIAILVFVAQVKAIVFAVILWFLGCEPRIHCRMSEPLDFQQSFLVVDSEKRDVGLKFKWRE
ncbi:tetraspanin-19-like isoform X2 [Cornus florida]|nr:tetraspanin-19-like isoform X2 [Cornus florida]XP_059658017.1 tetraspanin-19-like isoform X2 [Cornus florida]